MNAALSKRIWILLWICLILLNVVIRYPITPHEIGSDSFTMHFIADSISTYGSAKWWIHPLSIIGLYPYSTASALPFYLSGVSQSLYLGMEYTIWIVLLFFGILSSFTAYLMAGAIKNNEIFKFITAFVYSTSPGILIFTTWDASARGLFLVLLPLFIYFLIKSQVSLKYSLLTGILFILLITTHNFFYLLIPIIIIGVMINILISNSKSIYVPIIRIRPTNYFTSGMLLIIFLVTIKLSFILFSEEGVDELSVFFSNIRYSGVLIFFLIGGFISLLFKYDKTFEEWFLILVLLYLIPVLPNDTYSKFFMLPFASLLIGNGIINLISISSKRKTALYLVLIFFILSIGFSTFYQFERTGDQNRAGKFWAEESTVNAAMWTKAYTNKSIYSDDGTLSRRLLAYSGVRMLSETDVVNLIQGNLKYNLSTSIDSPLSTSFYFQGPVYIINQSAIAWYWYNLMNVEYDSILGKKAIQMFDLNYYIRNEKYYRTVFSNSVYKQKDKLFDNGDVSIWNLNQ